MKPLELDAALQPSRSRALLAEVGYDPQEVEDLHASGIAAVDFDTLSETAATEILGSDPPNICSLDAGWDRYIAKTVEGRVVLVDFYSGAVFRPVELRNFGMFGCSRLPAPFKPMLPEVPWDLRWRMNSIPAMLAGSSAEVRKAAASIKWQFRHKNQILFRGQPEQYPIPRQPRTLRLLYGDSCPLEPSLLTTAFRKRFPYLSAERHWRAIIAEVDQRRGGYTDNRWQIEDPDETLTVGDHGMISRWQVTSTMAMSQHYGLPTYGLDVTESVEVAWWFATHDFVEEGDRAKYVPHVWSSLPVERWPVIYVFASGTSVRISKLDLPATRPNRQKAVFAAGGWGLHGNRCADDLLAVIVIAPDVGVAPGDTESLFPSAKDDPMYDELLKLKTRLTANHPLYKAAGLQYMPEYVS